MLRRGVCEADETIRLTGGEEMQSDSKSKTREALSPTHHRTCCAPDLQQQRLAALDAPRMASLEEYRAGLATSYGDVPHFDPFDGGAHAACLMLLETPGPRAGVIRFVSRDNETATARNITRFCDMAGLCRRDMILWNAVPWVIHAAGARNRAPTRAETDAGLALLPGLLGHLPNLRVVVLAGRVAGLAAAMLSGARRMPHPSPIYVNTAPAIAPGIVATLRSAAKLVADQQTALSPGSMHSGAGTQWE